MYRNLIRIAWRNLLRFRWISLFNVMGLSIGMSTSLLILLYIRHELSFDQFHPDAEMIYRIVSKVEDPEGQTFYIPATLGWIPDELGNAGYADLLMTRIYREDLISSSDRQPYESLRYFYVDPAFFDIFGFSLLRGDAGSLLSGPNTLVLTEQTSKRYFGDTDPLGRQFRIHDHSFEVAGILKDPPANSHLQFDVLLSMDTWLEKYSVYNRSLDFPLYLKVDPPAEGHFPDSLIRRVEQMVREHYQGTGAKVTCELQSLEHIHLGSGHLIMDLGKRTSRNDLLILGFLAAFILAVTLPNFIHLVNSGAVIRTRQMAIRMVFGAGRQDLMHQLMAESLLLAVGASFLAMVLFELILRPFTSIIGGHLPVTPLAMVIVFLIFLLMALAAGVLSGMTHHQFVRRYPLTEMLSGLKVQIRKNRLVTSLLLIQYAVMIFLCSVLSVLYAQTRYMQKGEQGYEPENLYVFQEPYRPIQADFRQTRESLSHLPGVLSVTASQGIPGEIPTLNNAWPEGGNEEEAIFITDNWVQQSYPETYRMKLLEGEWFRGNTEADTGGFLLNEAAVAAMGLKQPVGSVINVYNHKDTVIGVVQNFHFRSKREPIKPLVISRHKRTFRYVTIRAETDTIEGLLDAIQLRLEQKYPAHAFVRFPLSSMFSQLYQEEQRKILLYASGMILALLISVFGLFAMSTYTTVWRTKEIGIRKILGGTELMLYALLSSKIIRWVLFAGLLAAPLSWWAVGNWLDNYYYRIGYEWLLILISFLFGMILSIGTISYQVIRITRRNPAVSLRYE